MAKMPKEIVELFNDPASTKFMATVDSQGETLMLWCIQEPPGHESSRTTEIYTHVAMNDMRKIRGTCM